MDFWRKHLEGVRGQWDFPTDEFRPAVPTGNSKRVSVSLKTSTVQALKDLASQVGLRIMDPSPLLDRHFKSSLQYLSVILLELNLQVSIVCY